MVLLIALALIGGGGAPARAAAEPTGVTCEACIVVDGKGRVLWAREPHTPLPNASTTKMVTALLVVDEAQPDEQVTVSATAAATGGGGLDLLEGDTYSVEDLLYALMLSSSNDSAVALAEHVSGSEAVFVDAMNRYLDDLGADDTSFVTPHGLDAPGHVASPTDLAAIGMEVLDHPVLADIVATPEKTIEGSSGPQFLENRNLLLETYRGATGIKTGSTILAGEVLVASAERRGDLVVTVAMRSLDAIADSQALLDFGFARLADEVIVERGTVVTEAVLDPGGVVDIVTSTEIRVLPPGDRVRRNVRLNPSFASSVRQGERVGTLELVSEGKVVASAPLETGSPIEPPDESILQSLVEALLSLVYSAGKAVGVD